MQSGLGGSGSLLPEHLRSATYLSDSQRAAVYNAGPSQAPRVVKQIVDECSHGKFAKRDDGPIGNWDVFADLWGKETPRPKGHTRDHFETLRRAKQRLEHTDKEQLSLLISLNLILGWTQDPNCWGSVHTARQTDFGARRRGQKVSAR